MISLRAMLVLAAGLLLAGGTFDSPSLFVVGGALGGLAILLRGWVLGVAAGARVERSELPERVIEGEPIGVSYRIRGGALGGRVRLDDPLLPRPLELSTPRGWRSKTVRAAGFLPLRGRHALTAPELVVDDLLGVSHRRLSAGEGGTVLVLPAVAAVVGPFGERGPSAESLRRGATEANGGVGVESLEDPELDALGIYRPGTPASRIYWPSLARGAELMERRLTSADGAGAVIVLDPSDATGPDLDAAVRATASLVVHLGVDRGCELILGGSRRAISIRPRLGGWAAAHARLATVAASDGAPPAREIPESGALFWVRASERSRVEPRGGYLITPGEGGAGAAFEVAGCRARLLGNAGSGAAAIGAAA